MGAITSDCYYDDHQQSNWKNERYFERYGVSPSQLDQWRHEGYLGYYRTRHDCYLYDKTQVLDIVAKNIEAERSHIIDKRIERLLELERVVDDMLVRDHVDSWRKPKRKDRQGTSITIINR